MKIISVFKTYQWSDIFYCEVKTLNDGNHWCIYNEKHDGGVSQLSSKLFEGTNTPRRNGGMMSSWNHGPRYIKLLQCPQLGKAVIHTLSLEHRFGETRHPVRDESKQYVNRTFSNIYTSKKLTKHLIQHGAGDSDAHDPWSTTGKNKVTTGAMRTIVQLSCVNASLKGILHRCIYISTLYWTFSAPAIEIS